MSTQTAAPAGFAAVTGCIFWPQFQDAPSPRNGAGGGAEHGLKIISLSACSHVASRYISSMQVSSIVRQAAGHNLRGMTVADAYRFVRYAQADGALTPVDALNVRNALHAWEWLLSTGRLAAAAHAALKNLSGAKLAATLDKVLANASEPTVAAYAAQWKEAA